LTILPDPWYCPHLNKEISAKPRPTRFFLPVQAHHIAHWGNNRQPVFFSEDDLQFFLEWP
jgi:hypothetical protein